MTRFAMAAALEDIEKAGEIRIEISVRIFQRIANAGLGGQMHDWPELDLGKNAFDRAPLGEIDLVKRKFVKFAQDGQPRLLQRRIVVIVDAVNAHHRPASFKKMAGKSKADEACGAGNKYGILRHNGSAS